MLGTFVWVLRWNATMDMDIDINQGSRERLNA